MAVRWSTIVAVGLAVLAAHPHIGRGQTPPSTDDGAIHPEHVRASQLPYLPLLDEIFGHLADGNAGEVLRVFAGKDAALEEAHWDNKKRELGQFIANAGRYDGFDLVAIRPIAPRYHTIYCLVQYERHPIVFVFQARQFEGRWRLLGYSFSSNIDMLSALVPHKLVLDDRPDPPAKKPQAPQPSQQDTDQEKSEPKSSPVRPTSPA